MHFKNHLILLIIPHTYLSDLYIRWLDDEILSLPASNSSVAFHCTWPEMTTPRPHCNPRFLPLYPHLPPPGHCVTGLWPYRVSFCSSNTQAHSYVQVGPPEVSSSWKDFLPALGMPDSFLISTSQHKATSESPNPAPPPAASRPSWTHHYFCLLHGTVWIIRFVYFLIVWLLS